MTKLNKFYSGFTLAEVLAAIAILIVGIVAVLFLTSYNLTMESQSQKRLLASHLARENIEALRASRDSNWLNGGSAFSSWSTWYSKDNLAYIQILTNDIFNWQAVNSADPIVCGATCQVWQNQNQNWPVWGVNNGTLTPFRRLFTIKPICWSNDGQVTTVVNTNEDCIGYDALAGYQIESVVAWEFNGSWKQVSIIERLYDWR